MNKCRKNNNRLKNLRIKIIKKKKEKKGKKKKKKENPIELQKSNTETEVYNNSKKCD